MTDPHTAEPSGYRTGAVLALLAALGFSLKAIFVKLAYQHGVGATTLLTLRLLISLPVFAIVALRTSQGAERLTRRQWLALGAVGLLGYYGASILDFAGLKYISAGLERLILFTYPTLTVLIGVLFQGKRLQRLEVVALALSYGGIAVAFMHDLRMQGDPRSVAIGAAFVLGSALCFAFYLSGSAPLIARLGAARFTALAMLVSTAGVLVHHAVTDPLGALVRQPWPVHAYAAAMALVSTVLPVFMQSAAIRRVGAGRAALLGTTGPMITILLGWWLLGEPLSAAQLAGMALVVGGVALVTRPSSAD